MFKFAFLIFLNFLLLTHGQEEYEAPNTSAFPLGDEELNDNALSSPEPNELNKSGEAPNLQLPPCKTDEENVEPKENSVECNDQDKGDSSNDDPIYSAKIGCPDLGFDTESSRPDVECKKCELNITPDNTAVILKCFECFDLPAETDPENSDKRNIRYMVSYLQIANYTTASETDTKMLSCGDL